MYPFDLTLQRNLVHKAPILLAKFKDLIYRSKKIYVNMLRDFPGYLS